MPRIPGSDEIGRTLERIGLFRPRSAERVSISYVLSRGVILSGLQDPEPSQFGFSVRIDADNKSTSPLVFVARLGANLFSFRYADEITISAGSKRVRVTILHEGTSIAARTMDVGAFVGAIDNVQGGFVQGWVAPAFNLAERRTAEIIVNDTIQLPLISDRYRLDISPLLAGHAFAGFKIEVPSSLSSADIRAVELVASEGVIASWKAEGHVTEDVPEPAEAIAPVQDIRRLKAEIRAARVAGDRSTWEVCIQQLSRLRGPSPSACLTQESMGIRTDALPRRNVTVIVPVYRDAISLRRCIEHLLRSKEMHPFEILAVNDKSPEFEVRAYLNTLSSGGQITLLENDYNLGFVGSVNRGMASTPTDHDVVLLNSDAFVPLNWIVKLAAVAYSQPAVASVTPISNAATIFSYPRPNHDNPMSSLGLQALDGNFERASELIGCSSVVVPTGVGFCMYLTRTAIAEIGVFSDQYAPGYGEENDWCKRAEDRGFVHLGATNTFVEHVGSVSFSKDRDALITSHMNILNRSYPEYMPEVTDFIEQDRFGVFRLAVDILGFLNSQKMLVIHFLHGWGGGISEHVADVARLTSEDALHVLSATDRDNPFQFRVMVARSGASHTLMRSSFYTLLRALFTAEDVRAFMHFHSLIGILDDTENLISFPEAKKIATIHDYSLRCPRIFLLTAGDLFCGLPDVQSCERCIALEGPLSGMERDYVNLQSVHSWVSIGQHFLARMDRLIFPSADLSARFPAPVGVAAEIIPHLEKPIAPFTLRNPRTPLRVGVIGAIGAHKGARALLRLAELVYLRDLPIELVIIGYTDDDKVFDPLPSLVITGPYERESLPVLLHSLELDFILIPSIWPETYSFTVSEAWRGGLPVMTIFEGAHSDRVMKEQSFGYFPVPSLRPDDLVQAVLAFAAELAARAGQTIAPTMTASSDWFSRTYN